jgi:hypothetical protein
MIESLLLISGMLLGIIILAIIGIVYNINYFKMLKNEAELKIIENKSYSEKLVEELKLVNTKAIEGHLKLNKEVETIKHQINDLYNIKKR